MPYCFQMLSAYCRFISMFLYVGKDLKVPTTLDNLRFSNLRQRSTNRERWVNGLNQLMRYHNVFQRNVFPASNAFMWGKIRFDMTTSTERSVYTLTLFAIQQICSRRLWKHVCTHMETLYKWENTHLINSKTLWQKEKLLNMSKISCCHSVFKGRLLQTHQKASVFGKGIIKSNSQYTYSKITKADSANR